MEVSAMMKMEAFGNKDLQDFTAFLSMAEGAGVTDIRFLRQRLQEDVNRRYLESNP